MTAFGALRILLNKLNNLGLHAKRRVLKFRDHCLLFPQLDSQIRKNNISDCRAIAFTVEAFLKSFTMIFGTSTGVVECRCRLEPTAGHRSLLLRSCLRVCIRHFYPPQPGGLLLVVSSSHNVPLILDQLTAKVLLQTDQGTFSVHPSPHRTRQFQESLRVEALIVRVNIPRETVGATTCCAPKTATQSIRCCARGARSRNASALTAPAVKRHKGSRLESISGMFRSTPQSRSHSSGERLSRELGLPFLARVISFAAPADKLLLQVSSLSSSFISSVSIFHDFCPFFDGLRLIIPEFVNSCISMPFS